MIAAIADTHTAIWYLYKDRRLSASAREFIEYAAQTGNEIVISPISLVEIVYLIEKGSIKIFVYDDLNSVLRDPQFVIKEAPITSSVMSAMWKIPRAQVPDMPDRIIAATAMYFGVPVITRDRKIQNSSVETIW